jgi:hypothetical protein
MGCKFSSGVTSPVSQNVEEVRVEQRNQPPAAQTVQTVDEAPAVPPAVSSPDGGEQSLAVPVEPTTPSTPPSSSSSRRKFVLKRDPPDCRDLFLNVSEHSKVKAGPIPPNVDLRPKENFPVYDQGELGSCTAQAIGAAFHYEQLRQGLRAFCPSRLFIYYNERQFENTVAEDSGASLRDGMLAIYRIGVCEEEKWPYAPSDFTMRPTSECYATASLNRCKRYARVRQDLESLKGCLVAGHPFVFGFMVYSDFLEEDLVGGKMPFPPTGVLQGGHAVQACGYDDEKQCFIVRNSWGQDWAEGGHFYMPYPFITDPEKAFDFWAIKWLDGQEFPVDGDDMSEQPQCLSCFGC